MDLPFALETALEEQIATDTEWRTGIEWGEARSGHPEGAVKWHVAEVLAALDSLAITPADRARLRLAALVHDTFKVQVDRAAPRLPPNEHGSLAAQFLEARLRSARLPDARLVSLVELHDEGYRAWVASLEGREGESWDRVSRIVDRMDGEIELFVAFYWADNSSGDKTQDQLPWFVDRLVERGITARLPKASAR